MKKSGQHSFLSSFLSLFSFSFSFFFSFDSLLGKLPDSDNGWPVSDTTFNSSIVITFAGTNREFLRRRKAVLISLGFADFESFS